MKNYQMPPPGRSRTLDAQPKASNQTSIPQLLMQLKDNASFSMPSQRAGDEKNYPSFASPSSAMPAVQRRVVVNKKFLPEDLLKNKLEFCHQLQKKMPDIPDEEFDFIFEQLVILENNKKKILFKDFQEMIWRVRKIGAEGIIREEIERSKIERSIQAQWEKVEERLQAVEERLQAVEEQWEILQQMREAQASIKEARRLKGQSRPPKGARPVPPPPAEPEEEPLDAGFVCTDITYPHEGKHCPPTGVEGNMNLLKEKTKGDEPSLFITRASFEVRRWDYIAMQHGLTVDNGSTKIFNFDFWIGASDNEESQWMRLDGDHSHPITEAAFDDIIIREIERAVTNKASDRIQEICNWLTKRKIDFKYYLRKSKCPHDLIPHES